MSHYDINLPLIFQDRPVHHTEKHSVFPDQSWTTSTQGYLYEAGKLATCIKLNAKLGKFYYTWEVTVNIDEEQSPTALTATWSNISRNLRRLGVVALWVREPSRSNRVHYHLIVRSHHRHDDLTGILRRAIPDGLPHHTHIDRIKHHYHYPRYITKAKTAGLHRGAFTEDKYKHKRLLFRIDLGLRKYGTVGRFWVESKDDLWERVKLREREIANNLKQSDLQVLIAHLQDWFPHELQTRLVRCLAINYSSPGISRWCSSLVETQRIQERTGHDSRVAEQTAEASRSTI